VRETANEKARRYVAEGRLVVTLVAGDVVRATCRGTGESYELGHDPARGWFCSCPARRWCSHLAALALVAVRRGEQ
jgi:hypothetical protein